MSDDEGRDAAVAQLWAERDCVRLLHRYFALIDGGRAGAAIDLLGASPVVEAAGKRWEGREVIAEAMRQRQAQTDRQTRHVVANLVLDVDLNGGAASATGNLLVFATNGERPTVPQAVSALEMRFVRDGDWKIELHRSLRLAEASA